MESYDCQRHKGTEHIEEWKITSKSLVILFMKEWGELSYKTERFQLLLVMLGVFNIQLPLHFL